MFDQIFFSPQVKRSVIISNRHGIYELPKELPNDLKLNDHWKLENIHRKYQEKLKNFLEL